jgi:hypothetical protein
MLKRRLKLLGKILLGIIVLLAALLLIERWRGQIALASYKKELRAKGEKLSPQDFSASPLTPTNDAAPVIATIEKLQPGKIITGSLPPLMKPLTSGRAIVGFREPEWVESGSFKDGGWVENKTTNRWEQVAECLKSNTLVLVEICGAMQKPTFVNAIDYAAGPKVKIPHLSKSKSLAQWLQAEVALALHEGRRANAVAALECQIQIPKLMAEDKILISELVRCAVGSIARVNTWEALQLDGWQDDELVRLQTAWGDQQFTQAMTAALEYELMFMTIAYHQFRSSNQETYETLEVMDSFGPIFSALANSGVSGKEINGIWTKVPFHEEIAEFWRRQIYCRTWRFAWSHQAEHKALSEVYPALELAREGASKKSYAMIKPKFDALDAAEKPGFYDRLRLLFVGLTGTYSKSVVRAMRAETDRSLCLTAIALKRYSLRHGKLPENLNALAPEFLPAVPVDYMDGHPIKYRLNPDGSFVLYSVGEDGKDDGGDMTLPEGSQSRDLWKRRDYVWPAPAAPEEVAEYRRNAGKD